MPTLDPHQHSTAELTPEAVPVALSIREVAKQTGLSESVLRVWEFRYGWPRPGRRPNGYRFYSIALIPLLQAVREEIERGRTIGDLLRDPKWSEVMESGLLPSVPSATKPQPPDWSSIPSPQSEMGCALRTRLQDALERGNAGLISSIRVQGDRLHPKERDLAITAVIRLWEKHSQHHGIDRDER